MVGGIACAPDSSFGGWLRVNAARAAATLGVEGAVAGAVVANGGGVAATDCAVVAAAEAAAGADDAATAGVGADAAGD